MYTLDVLIMTPEINVIFLIIHLFFFIVGILLIYYAIRLLQRLTSKDFAVSMIFLNEDKIKNILLVLVVGSFIFFAGHLYTSYADFFFETGSVSSSTTIDYILLNIIGPIYSITLLYFVYALQKILRGDE